MSATKNPPTVENGEGFGNITIRAERGMLDRLDKLEAATRLTRSAITRAALDAVLTEFERTGSIPVPLKVSANTPTLEGKLMEMGDDEEGQPRIVIRTTREEIVRVLKASLYGQVHVSPKP